MTSTSSTIRTATIAWPASKLKTWPALSWAGNQYLISSKPTRRAEPGESANRAAWDSLKAVKFKDPATGRIIARGNFQCLRRGLVSTIVHFTMDLRVDDRSFRLRFEKLRRFRLRKGQSLVRVGPRDDAETRYLRRECLAPVADSIARQLGGRRRAEPRSTADGWRALGSLAGLAWRECTACGGEAWPDARETCSRLEAGQWRLPARVEMENARAKLKLTAGRTYWTSTEYHDSSRAVWRFRDGEFMGGLKNRPAWVLCVAKIE